MMFNDQVIQEAKSHALEAYPFESCGMVVADRYIACPNVHPNPRESFRIDPVLYPINGTLQAIIHSHPDGYREPTEDDMRAQVDSARPWGIITVNSSGVVSDPLWWGNGVPIPPLVGRKFRWGPSGSDNGGDCFALIKDFYALEMGIKIPEFPRTYQWWHLGGDMYSENFAKVGFKRIDIKELKYGDIVLMKLLSPVTNHGGIFMGDKPGKQGLFLHHLIDRLSREEPFHPWVKNTTHYLRYDPEAIP